MVPPSMRPAMLALIHGTHLGIVKCKQRAREALYWPGMSAQIEDKVKDHVPQLRACTAETAPDAKSCLRSAVGDGCFRHLRL